MKKELPTQLSGMFYDVDQKVSIRITPVGEYCSYEIFKDSPIINDHEKIWGRLKLTTPQMINFILLTPMEIESSKELDLPKALAIYFDATSQVLM